MSFSAEQDYSDEIAREIDDEIRRIVEEAHQTAKEVLDDPAGEPRAALEDSARARDDRARGVRAAAGRQDRRKRSSDPPEPPSRSPEPPAEPERKPVAASPSPIPQPPAAGPRRRHRGDARLGRRERPRALSFSQAQPIMGVLNVTPDSFSDGGRFLEPDAAVAHGEPDGRRGGGPDRRRGRVDASRRSSRCRAEEELRRVVPVVERLVARVEAPISIDTRKAAVARAALAAGASFVNDVSALRGDPDMAGCRCRGGCRSSASCTCRASPGRCRTTRATRTWSPRSRRSSRSGSPSRSRRGSPRSRIWLDPGIGFGKTLEHNLELLAAAGRDRGDRPAGGRRGLPEALHRGAHGPPRGGAGRRKPGGGGDRLRAGGGHAPGPRRREPPGGTCPRCRGRAACYLDREPDGRDMSDLRISRAGSTGSARRRSLAPTPPTRTSRSRSPASRSSPITASPRPSGTTGQRLIFDISLDLEECDATVTDRLEDTIDYGAVCDAVTYVATERSYKTLERLCTAIADMLVERFRRQRRRGARDQARAAAAGWRRGGLGRGLALSALTRTGGHRLPRPWLQRRRPAGEPARGRELLDAHDGDRGRWRARRSTRRSRWVRCSTQPRLLQRRRRGRDRARAARRCSPPASGSSESSAAPRAAPRHGPRPIDVDLLLVGDLALAEEDLVLPHPELASRRFVLVPLLELEPELTLPDGARLPRRSPRSAPGSVSSAGRPRVA